MTSSRVRSSLLIALALVLCEAQAGVSYSSSVRLNQSERFFAFSVENLNSVDDFGQTVGRLMKGDFSGLKVPNAPVHKQLPLGDMINQDFNVRSELLGKVVLVENSQGPLDLAIYSDGDLTHAMDGVTIEANPSNLVIRGQTSGNRLCAMTLVNSQVTSELGTCAVLTIPVPPGGRVRVYVDGKLQARSAAAKSTMGDVLSESTTSGKKEALDSYIDHGGKITPAQVVKLVRETSIGSNKVDVLRTAIPNLTAPLSGASVVSIVDDIAMSSDKIDALRIAVSGVDAISAQDAARIIESVSMSSNKLEALRLIVGRVPGDQIEQLSDAISDEFMMSDAREANRILLRAKR